MNDGIYFEVFAVKDGVRYNIKIVSARDASFILTDSIINSLDKIIDPKEMKGKMVI